MDGDKKFRVYNRCKYDIGVTLMSGQQPNIKSGGFIMITVNDIMFIEGNAKRKPFSARMLVAADDSGKDVPFEDLGGYVDEYTTPHLSDDEIIKELNKSAKSITAWLNNIEEPEELHAIYVVAKSMDLNASKLKVIQAKMPQKDMLEDDE